MEPVPFGLVGAGPWARRWYAPLLAEGPETRLAVVWARDHEAARALAARHGAIAVETYGELLDRSAAVAFTVPPDIQAELAPIAARAGRAMILEKPIGFTLEQARGLAAEVNDAGVVNMLMLTNRFTRRMDDFIERVRLIEPYGGVAVMAAGAILPGAEFSTPWRLTKGVLIDNGPHVFDVLDTAVGSVRTIAVQGDPMRWNAITLTHDTGAVTTVNLSLTVDVPEFVFRLEAYGARGGALLEGHFDHAPTAESAARVRREFARAFASGAPHLLDVNRGLYVQEIIAAGQRSLEGGGVPEDVVHEQAGPART